MKEENFHLKKKRWLFAYTAITETQIKPKLKQFKWENIKLITHTRREYVKLLKKKLKKGAKLTNTELELEIVKFSSNKFLSIKF